MMSFQISVVNTCLNGSVIARASREPDKGTELLVQKPVASDSQVNLIYLNFSLLKYFLVIY